MFGLVKKDKKMGRPAKKFGERATYKQVAVTPEAHARIVSMAQRKKATIIDTVNNLVGI